MRKLLFLLFTTCSVVVNAQSASGFSLYVSPNPFIDRMLVSYTLTGADTLTIQVFDLAGVLKTTLQSNTVFAAGAYGDSLIMTAFSPSVYFVSGTSRHHGRSVKKIIKQQSTGLQAINSMSQLQVFPNPVNKELTVSGLPDKSLVLITNIAGQQLPLKVLSNSVFDLGELSSGLYFLEIRSEDARRSIKVVKE